MGEGISSFTIQNTIKYQSVGFYTSKLLRETVAFEMSAFQGSISLGETLFLEYRSIPSQSVQVIM